MTAALSEIEARVLKAFRDCTVEPLHQGAALNVAIETFLTSGYLTREGDVTQAGRSALEQRQRHV